MPSPFLPGDIVFVRGRKWLDRTLIWFMSRLSALRGRDGNSHFSHVGVMLTPELMLETTEGRTRGNCNLWHTYREEEIKVLRLPGMTPERALAGLVAVQDHLGEKYPAERLALHALTLNEVETGGFVCSELAAHWADGAGYPQPTLFPDTDAFHDYWAKQPGVTMPFFGKLAAHWPVGWDGPFIQPVVA